MTDTAQIYKNFFDKSLLRELVSLAESLDSRKQEFDLAKAPKAIQQAARKVQSRLAVKSNVAILKRYDLSDGFQSKAYHKHADPKRFAGAPLVFVSLSGQAVLSVEIDGALKEIRCQPNTVIVLSPNVAHWVSEPQNKNGIRNFLFLGTTTH